MAQSQGEPTTAPPPKLRGARGVMELHQGFAQGNRRMPGPGMMASPDILALEGRGLR